MRHGSASVAAANSGGGPAFYEWKVSGGAFSIRLAFDVIDRLGADVMKGFWSLPKRGVEIGGILLGRVAEGGQSVFVEDYEVAGCEHRRGPSFVLSEPDRRKLEKTLRKHRGGRQVVGFFRSHTRLGLYLDQDDTSLIESYFSNPNHVMLLIRPDSSGPGAAGFFFWEEGDIHRQSTYREFPFNTAKLREQEEGPAVATAAPTPVLVPRIVDSRAPVPEAPVPEPSPAEAPIPETPVPEASIPEPAMAETPVPKAPVPEAPVPKEPVPTIPEAAAPDEWLVPEMPLAEPREAPEPERPALVMPRTAPEPQPPLWGRRLRLPAWPALSTRLAMAAGLVMLLIGAGIAEYYIVRAPTGASAARSVAVLEVRQNGPYLQINWNRSAPAVLAAEHGVLSISDGNYTRDIDIDAQQLRTGSLAYLPIGNDVNFRLKLLGPKDTVYESLRVLTAETVAKAAPAPAATPAVMAAAVKPEPPEPAAAKPRQRAKRPFFDDGL